MQIPKLSVYLACALACTGLGCQKKIKTSSFIVKQNLKGYLGVGAGGKLQWMSEDIGGPSFTIHFTSASPCRNGANDIVGKPKAAAFCYVSDTSDGFYLYQILTSGKANSATDNVYIAYVDGCKGCNIVINKGGPQKYLPPVAPVQSDNPDTVLIDCAADKSAEAKPITASASQVLEWSQVGPATNTWEVTLPEGICTNGTTFGTYDGDKAISCSIQASVKAGSYSYSVKQKSCTSTGTAQLTIK